MSKEERLLVYLKEIKKDYVERRVSIEKKIFDVLISSILILCSLIMFIVLTHGIVRDDFPGYARIAYFFLVFLIIMFSFISIYFCLKTYAIDKYKYTYLSTSTVSKHLNNVNRVANDFLLENIDDLIYSIDKNIEIDNKKESFLVEATLGLKIQIIVYSLMIFSWCSLLSIIFYK